VSDEAWIHRRTLVGGRAPMHARRLYLWRTFFAGLASTTALAVYALYVVRDGELSPLELLLAGTALELSAFIFEVPTGVIADSYSRRLSIIAGIAGSGVGFAIMGAHPSFLFIAGGQVVWGFAWTLTSGATEAWVSDEIGEDAAAETFLRAEPLRQLGRLVGLPLGFGLGFASLQLPFLVGGAAHLVLAAWLLFVMGEAGYRPAAPGQRSSWARMRDTTVAGARAIRGRTLLVAAVGVMFLIGLSSEALDRLWSLHLIDNVGLPADADLPSFLVDLPGPTDVAIFGAIAIVELLGTLALLWVVRRVVDVQRAKQVTGALILLTGAQIVAWLAFGLAEAFWLAVLTYIALGWARVAVDPLFIGWVNRGLDPGSRATVLSMVSQSNAFGQIFGGPLMGVVAALRGVRTALVAAALLLAPALLLYGRESRRPEQAPPQGTSRRR
jgi:DHA3 family tetracycline resistance protein-like MFS transporter